MPLRNHPHSSEQPTDCGGREGSESLPATTPRTADEIVYYLPGSGGRLHTGLGEELASRGWSIEGRETIGQFRALPFQQKLDLIAHDLTERFWHEDARLIAVSLGAYLFLHTQTQMPPFPGRVILFSPIVGQFASADVKMGFVPPRSKKLLILAESGDYPKLADCCIYVGSDDWQSDPETVVAFGAGAQIPVSVVPNNGHMLDKAYVRKVLDNWGAGVARKCRAYGA